MQFYVFIFLKKNKVYQSHQIYISQNYGKTQMIESKQCLGCILINQFSGDYLGQTIILKM